MAATKPTYDLTLLLDADAPSERRVEILREVEKAISSGGGEIVSNHDWGVRNLAYEIAHHQDAEYHLLQLTGPPELLDRLRNALRVTDGVLRHRIIRLPANMPAPPALRPEPRAAAAPPTPTAPAETPAARGGRGRGAGLGRRRSGRRGADFRGPARRGPCGRGVARSDRAVFAA